MSLLSMTMYGLLLLTAVFLFSPHTFDQVCAPNSVAIQCMHAQIRWRRIIEKRESTLCAAKSQLLFFFSTCRKLLERMRSSFGLHFSGDAATFPKISHGIL